MHALPRISLFYELERVRLSRQTALLPSSHLASVLGWRWFFPRFSIFFIVGCPAQSRWRRSPRSKLVSRVVSGQVVVIFMPCSKNNDEAPPPKKFLNAMTVLRQAACVRFMRLHGIVQRKAREVGAERAERAYFIFHLEYI